MTDGGITPLMIPQVQPVQVRLYNALLCRVLPLEFTADTGAEAVAPQPLCRLSAQGAQMTQSASVPFAAAVSLYVRMGEDICRVEMSSLAAVGLQSELAVWARTAEADTEGAPSAAIGAAYAALPMPLCQAVLERLFSSAVAQVLAFFGCDGGFTQAPQGEVAWSVPVPLMLTLPDGAFVYMRVYFSSLALVRFILERIESLPLLKSLGVPFSAEVAVPVHIGQLMVSVPEAQDLEAGDVLFPDVFTPAAPQLCLPGGRRLVCAFEHGMLTVQGTVEVRDYGDQALGASATVVQGEDAMGQDIQKQNTTASATDTVSLEAADLSSANEACLQRAAIPVSFELGSVTLPLEELRSLQVGVTLALGGDVTSMPIYIRVGETLVGQGRLVDVAGMPAVQITSMTPPRASSCSLVMQGQAQAPSDSGVRGGQAENAKGTPADAATTGV